MKSIKQALKEQAQALSALLKESEGAEFYAALKKAKAFCVIHAKHAGITANLRKLIIEFDGENVKDCRPKPLKK